MATLVFSYQFVDGHGIRANCPIYVNVPDATTLTNLRAAWVALGTLLQNVSDAKLAQGRVTIAEAADSGWKASPVGASDVSEAGVLQFSEQDTTHGTGIAVPAWGESLMTTDKGMDLNAAGAIALINGLIDGFGSGSAYSGVSLGGIDLSGIKGGFLTSRSHRKQYRNKTFMSGGAYTG